MATIPSNEALARELVAILHADQLRPGDGNPTMAVRCQFGLSRPAVDFKAAIEEAAARGWITCKADGSWITITEAGFAAA